MADLKRSIPSMVDGLKLNQRKVLFCAFKWPIIQEIGVARFSGYASEHSAYHHGEASRFGSIIGMAQDFVGSNNINLLQPNGQFGSRFMGGKDHASGRQLYTQLSPITRYIFHKDDELVLNYLNDDHGRSIEPEWFIPVIPMVLVNGSERIPHYNPRDIIANLKRLLNGEAMVPMHPWYKGFKGTIQKTTSKDTGYITTGIVKEIGDENTLSITELPVRRWTQEYKEFLEAASQEGKDKTPFIEDYMARNDDTSVHFEIFMTEDQMNTARQQGFVNKFKLATTLSTASMRLLDANGVIKKYDTPEQILEDFFHLRLDFYEKRRKAMLRELKKASLLLENKVRFIREVVEGTIVMRDKKKDGMYVELKGKGYTPLPKETLLEASIAGAVDHVVREENEEEEEVAGKEEKPQTNSSKTVPRTEYDYLLYMGIGSLADDKRQKLQQQRDAKKKEFDELTNTLSKCLWLRDLDALDHQLDEQDKRDAIDEAERRKQQEKAMAKDPHGGRKARKAAVTPINVEPTGTSGSSPMETGNAPAVRKPRGRAAAGQKKAPAKNKGNYPSAKLSPEIAEEAPKKKVPAKRVAASPSPQRANKKRRFMPSAGAAKKRGEADGAAKKKKMKSVTNISY